MRTKIRRLMAKYDYPPDQENRAVELILEQALRSARVVRPWPAVAWLIGAVVAHAGAV